MSRWYPPPSTPIRVADGIKSRSTRGAIAKTWWSKRFIEVLEGFGLGSRLQRGRNYARRGQVRALEVTPGQVNADVQGSRAKPYRVRIGTTAYGKQDWARMEALLVENAWYTASLLAGEMPEDIEDVFSAAGLTLFPAAEQDLTLDCSCPDWEVPCKHLAAVFYLLAESFDEDPFAILAWRGREREVLLANLQAARSNATAADRDRGSWRPLEDCLHSFFDIQADVQATVPSSASSALLLDQLPDTGVAVRGHALADLLRPVYETLGES